MIDNLKKILGITPAPDYKDLISKGAVIIDVRTPGEYSGGHIRGSVNIPLNNLSSHVKKLKQHQIIITCCASGMRSASAKSFLQDNGFSEVYNGGGWSSLQSKIK